MQTLTHWGWFLLCFYQDRVGVTISKLGYFTNPGNNHTNRNVGGIVLSVVLSLASKHHWEHKVDEQMVCTLLTKILDWYSYV